MASACAVRSRLTILKLCSQAQPWPVAAPAAVANHLCTSEMFPTAAFVSPAGCGDLSDQTDCACNVHAAGGHLLCHDDVIGNRRVSYIIYLTGGSQLEGASARTRGFTSCKGPHLISVDAVDLDANPSHFVLGWDLRLPQMCLRWLLMLAAPASHVHWRAGYI